MDWALNPIVALGYFLVVCAASWLAFRFFERPAQSFLRRRLLSRRPGPGLAARS